MNASSIEYCSTSTATAVADGNLPETAEPREKYMMEFGVYELKPPLLKTPPPAAGFHGRFAELERIDADNAVVSEDGGETWDTEHEICLARSHSSDLGYPSTVALGGGRYLTLYYQQSDVDQLPCLMATKWRLK